MGSGCSVEYPKGGPGGGIDHGATSGRGKKDWKEALEHDEEPVVGGVRAARREADVFSRRKIEKVKALLSEESQGQRLADEEVVGVLRSTSAASLQFGYKRFVEECMSKLEFDDKDVIRAFASASRGGSGAISSAAEATPMCGRRAATRILSNIDDDDDDRVSEVF